MSAPPKKERPWCQHGLNPELTRTLECGPVYDYLKGDPVAKQIEMLVSGENLNPTRDAMLSMPHFKGYALHSEYGYAADSWVAKLYNQFKEKNAGVEPQEPLGVKVLIPELTCLPCPDKIGENGSGIIGAYPTFYTHPSFHATKAPPPGAIVMVEFADPLNFGNGDGGLYLGEVDGQFRYTPPGLGARELYATGYEAPIFAGAEEGEHEVVSLARMLINEAGFMPGARGRKVLASREQVAIAWAAMNRREKYRGPAMGPATITDVVYSRLKTGRAGPGPVWSAGADFNAKLNTAFAHAGGRSSRVVQEALKLSRKVLSGAEPNPIGRRTSYIHIATQLKKGRKLTDWLVPATAASEGRWVVPMGVARLLKADKELVRIGCAERVGGPIIVPKSRLPEEGLAVREPLTIGRATFV